jgi:hypothetical protein
MSTYLVGSLEFSQNLLSTAVDTASLKNYIANSLAPFSMIVLPTFGT